MQSDLQDELLNLENQFWQCMKDKNIAKALEMTNDPCIVTGAQGVAQIDKKTFARLMESGSWVLHEFEIRDAQVQQLSDDVAIIGYKVREKLTVDGQPLTMEAADASTWVRKDGRWVCALHTESVAGDPYGRDHQKTH
jgi:hypothetical protein